ncbi:MAG: HlyC/CorC family transporter [Dehalococcoidia bacterium]|nr:MAG: HlyC/CorC family transporter [Dehalococcoidia bacterium]
MAALVLLVLVTAAEAAVASSNRARLRLLAGKGASRSQILARYLEERHTVYSSLALARNLALVGSTAIVVYIVLNEVGLNWVVLAVTFFLALLALAVIQAVPRLVISRNPEKWVSYLAPFVDLVRLLFHLPSAVLDLPARALLRWRRLGAEDTEMLDEPEELLRVLEMEESAGLMDEDERKMIRSVMALEDTTAREIMVPRIDIVAAPSDSSFEEIAKAIVERPYSRIPIFEDTIDNIVGVVYAREVLGYLANSDKPADVKAVARPPYFVPESKKVDELLTEMRRNKLSIAIVVDEYGGTAGLVTIEDLIEEIVGEIADEFDVEEEPIHRVSDSEAILDARVSIDALQELFGIEVEEGDFDTVGGFVFNHLGKMPSVGEEIRVDGLVVRVLSVSGRRIKRLRVIKEEPPPPEDGGNNEK